MPTLHRHNFDATLECRKRQSNTNLAKDDRMDGWRADGRVDASGERGGARLSDVSEQAVTFLFVVVPALVDKVPCRKLLSGPFESKMQSRKFIEINITCNPSLLELLLTLPSIHGLLILFRHPVHLTQRQTARAAAAQETMLAQGYFSHFLWPSLPILNAIMHSQHFLKRGPGVHISPSFPFLSDLARERACCSLQSLSFQFHLAATADRASSHLHGVPITLASRSPRNWNL